MSWGQRIREIREERGWSVQEAADVIYVTRQAWYYWECGLRIPRSRLVLETLQNVGFPIPEKKSLTKV